jgi:hypothetical protein
LTAMVAIAATAIVWSIGTVARPKFAGNVADTAAPISPHELMVKQGKTLPVEFWDAF